MGKLKNPHDRFFKETLSVKENARSFLESYLRNLPDSEMAYLVSITVYILHATKVPLQKFAEIVEQNISKKGGEIVMTTSEQLICQGEEIGIKKGEEIGIKKGEEIGIKKGKEIGIKEGEKYGKIKVAQKCWRKGSLLTR